MKLVAFAPDHLNAFDWQEAQADFKAAMTPDIVEWAMSSGYATTGLDDDGAVIGCAGWARWDETKAVVWAAFSPLIKGRALELTRLVRRVLATCPLPRIEAHIEANHVEAARWAVMLGFRFEAVIPNAVPGHDVLLFARERA